MKIYKVTSHKRIFGMATPTQSIRNRKYYHMTKSDEEAMFVLKHGICPSDSNRYPESFYKPQIGMTYFFPSVEEAIKTYLSDIHDSIWLAKNGHGSRYKYLFVVNGNNFKSIHPDEDSIGEAVSKRTYPILNQTAEQNIDHSILEKVYEKAHSSYEYMAHIGKELMNIIPDDLKIQMVEDGCRVSNCGCIDIDEAWKLDLFSCNDLYPNGSNFFNVAERIK